MTPAERATADWARPRPFGGSLPARHGPSHRSRCGGRLGSGQDHPHPGARPGPRRRQRRAPERRRLPPLRPPRAAQSRRLAAAPGRQLPRHPDPAPRAAPARAVGAQAGLRPPRGDARAPAPPAPRALPHRRGAAQLPHRDAAPRARRARVPRPARGAAPGVEAQARLHAPRLHDRPGPVGARPPRARRRGVHPPPAGSRRHRRELPTPATAAIPGAWTRRSSCATRCRTRTSRRSSTTRTTARGSSAASASCCCGSRATSTPATPRCWRRRSGSG